MSRSSPAGRRSCAIWAFSIAPCWSSTRWATARAAPPIAHSLIDYFTAHQEKLSADSRERLERNPLRILDSKDQGDRALIAEAPRFGEYLNQKSRDFFAAVTGGLEALGIAYQLNPRLVRGLDYYCHTAFEFTTTELGAQGTVMGGGRYDGLIDIMGGPATAGVGWAAGIERMAHDAGRDAGRAPARGAWCRWARMPNAMRPGWRNGCAARASPSNWAMAAISASG